MRNTGVWVSMLLIGVSRVIVLTHYLPAPVVEREAEATAPTGPKAAPSGPKAPPAAARAAPTGANATPFSYHVNAPDQVLTLDDKLDEISDLSVAADGQSLWAVHDDKRKLFRIAMKDGAIVETIELGRKGDFEGVANMGAQVLVAGSKGMLLTVDAKTHEVAEFATVLGPDCNLEGVAYEHNKSRLLLACKTPLNRPGGRSWGIYAMALPSKEMAKEPAYIITERMIDAYVTAHPEQTDLKDIVPHQFDPSGITVHPKNGHYYMITTRGRMIMELDEAFKPLRIEPLQRSVLPQPEGIAFAADGTLFISSEARGSHPLLTRFSLKMSP